MSPQTASPSTLDAWLQANPSAPGWALAALCLIILYALLRPHFRSRARAKGRPVVDPLHLEEMILGGGALVVDLREEAAFRAGHIRGALHAPFATLDTRFQRPDPVAKRPMVLVDETDELAHRALDRLASRGYQWLYVLEGGMRAWRKASRPMAR